MLNTRLKDIIEPKQSYCTPSGATEKTLTGAAGAWAAGSYTEIIAASTLTAAIIFNGVEVVTVTGIHQIEIAIGAAASEVVVATIPVGTTGFKPTCTVEIEPGVRVAARTRSKAGGSETTTVFFTYEARP